MLWAVIWFFFFRTQTAPYIFRKVHLCQMVFCITIVRHCEPFSEAKDALLTTENLLDKFMWAVNYLWNIGIKPHC